MRENLEADTAGVAGARLASRTGHFRVLVVDDNEMDRQLTVMQLGQAWPFEHDLAVESASNGAEALEKLQRMRFALVLVDWKMPVMGGGIFLQSMRRLGIRVPVVVVSGSQRSEISEDIESLGASFLNKNEFNPVSFRASIAASIQLQGLLPEYGTGAVAGGRLAA